MPMSVLRFLGVATTREADPGAEQSIDEDVGRRIDALRGVGNGDAEAPDSERVTTRQAAGVPRGDNRRIDDCPTLQQEAGRDQRVPAVIARPGDDAHTFALDAVHERVDEPGDLPAGDLHQLQRLDPEGRGGLGVGPA